MRQILSTMSIALVAMGCGSDPDPVAGRGVITETTNGVAARGRLVTADSTPVVEGRVRVVLDEDIPESWNGAARDSSLVDPTGAYRLIGLDHPNYTLYAVAKDGKGRFVAGQFSFRVGDSDVVLPDFAVAAQARMQGRFAAYDSVSAALPTGWFLRATVRGLGSWIRLDSVGGWHFDSIPSGIHHVRIQKVDGNPTHETTIQVEVDTAR